MKKVLGLLLTMVLAFSLVACSSSSSDSTALKFGQVQYAAHGTKSFAVTTVVMDGDKIVKAYIDEYQVLSKEGTVGVPNSDAEFGENFASLDTQLASKRVNDDFYSNNMATKGGATQKLSTSWDAIQKFAEGKTISELESAISGKTAEQVIDAVSGATLTDTTGYIQSIIEAAKAAK